MAAEERPLLLYDRVFRVDAQLCIKVGAGPSQQAPGRPGHPPLCRPGPPRHAPQAPRDTYNPTALRCERRLGPYKTTAALSYPPPPPSFQRRPQFGHRAVMANTFYRRDHVFSSQDA